jgi:hypothetical protein
MSELLEFSDIMSSLGRLRDYLDFVADAMKSGELGHIDGIRLLLEIEDSIVKVRGRVGDSNSLKEIENIAEVIEKEIKNEFK